VTTHDEYIHRRIERDPGFAESLADARAELKFAESLAAERERLGLTQAEVAVRAGMKQAAIARYEKAGRTPSLLTLWRLAGALDCEIVLGPGRSMRLISQQLASSSSGSVQASGLAADEPAGREQAVVTSRVSPARAEP
jgi:HTH-type transcriptional regulator/antitoxin HipB